MNRLPCHCYSILPKDFKKYYPSHFIGNGLQAGLEKITFDAEDFLDGRLGVTVFAIVRDDQFEKSDIFSARSRQDVSFSSVNCYNQSEFLPTSIPLLS